MASDVSASPGACSAPSRSTTSGDWPRSTSGRTSNEARGIPRIRVGGALRPWRRIIAFVATTQPDAAQTFYVDTLGLTLTNRDQYALVFDAGGTMLRVVIVEQLQPQGFTVLGWHVPDIAAAVTQLVKRGVVFKRYESLPQDDLGIWHTPDGARVAWFADPDGNILSLTQLD